MTTRLVIGAMTGTSVDGIDVAVARITGRALDLDVELLRHVAADLGPIRDDLRRAVRGAALAAEQFASLALDLGRRHAEVIEHAAEGLGPIDLIAAHGQTLAHRPPVSWQILNPAPIVDRFACPVVCDLRQADLAAGGQGAPITPLADWVLFRDRSHRRAVVNLGGFCNVTILPREAEGGSDRVQGFDVCACNQVLDEVAQRALHAPFDRDGCAAASGTFQDDAVDELYEILDRQRSSRRSLGTGDEARSWVETHTGRLPPHDLAASAVEAVARCIGAAVKAQEPDEVIVAGGGARHRVLIERLGVHGPGPVRTSDDLGVGVAAREALAMAVLGALCADGVSIALPHVTGSTGPGRIAGTWCLPGGLMGG